MSWGLWEEEEEGKKEDWQQMLAQELILKKKKKESEGEDESCIFLSPGWLRSSIKGRSLLQVNIFH